MQLSTAVYSQNNVKTALFLGNNKPIFDIGRSYEKILGFDDNENDNSGGGSQNSDTSHIEEDIQVGFLVEKENRLYKEFFFKYGLSLSVGKTSLFFPDGIGIFVEEVAVSSTNLEIEPNISINRRLSAAVDIELGLSHSKLWTRDKFNLGSWEIYEDLSLSKTSEFFKVNYRVNETPMFFSMGIYGLSSNTYFNFRFGSFLERRGSFPVALFDHR